MSHQSSHLPFHPGFSIANGGDAEEHTMATQKCAHPACDCQVDGSGEYGKYCSDYCKRSGQQLELHCNCQHPNCG